MDQPAMATRHPKVHSIRVNFRFPGMLCCLSARRTRRNHHHTHLAQTLLHGAPPAQRALGRPALADPRSEEGISCNLPHGSHPGGRACSAWRHDLRLLTRASGHAFAPAGNNGLQGVLHSGVQDLRGERCELPLWCERLAV